MSLSLDAPVTSLDPYNADPETEWNRLRALGHLVPIELDGAVRTWATADHATAERVFTSPAFSKDPTHWAAFQQGHIPEGWPLLPLITMKSMLNREGDDHTRLRALLAKAFTPRRIELLRPLIEDMARRLLDSLETADGVVDLRRQYA